MKLFEVFSFSEYVKKTLGLIASGLYGLLRRLYLV